MYIEIFGDKNKDFRVDKIAMRHGYSIYEVFYSPIIIWIFMTIYFLVLSISAFFQFLGEWYYIIPYLLFGYLISSYLNNSFVITEKELLIINPNFPFNSFERYSIDSIEKVKIDSNKWLYLLFSFLIFDNNYVKITSKDKTRVYYCIGLQFDAFDENFTEKTLDDFSASLSKKDIVVECIID